MDQSQLPITLPHGLCFAAISWDEESSVWYVAATDFPGLAAEAETGQELVRKVRQLVSDLRDANRHLMRQDERLVMEFER